MCCSNVQNLNPNTMYLCYPCPLSPTQLRDEFEFRGMLRMAEDQYQTIVNKVRPIIEREWTQLRPPITAEEKVSVTLTYLAYGEHKRKNCASAMKNIHAPPLKKQLLLIVPGM